MTQTGETKSEPAIDETPSSDATNSDDGFLRGCIWIISIGFIVILFLFLSRCIGHSSRNSSPIDYGLDAKVDALAEVRANLRDPDSAEFSGVEDTLKSGGRVVCGYVNSRNGFGGMTGPQRFIVDEGTTMEEQVGAGVMSKLWAEKCN